MQVLGETHFNHFCQNEADFVDRDEHIDFPIRDPLATSVSWRCYQTDRTDMDEFRRWEAAITFLRSRPHTVHRIEDHPVLDGESSPSHWYKKAIADHDLDALKKLPEIQYLLEWIEQPHIADFFKKYYPEGFWWQSTDKQHS